MNNKLLAALEEDCKLSVEQLAAKAGMTPEEARAEIRQAEEDRLILGYKAIVDWERTAQEAVTALIEVNVTPQRGEGFDMTVIISGRSLKEVAQFVGQKLAPIEGVTGTATHFILKKYKEKHLIFEKQEKQEEGFVYE